MYVILKLGRKDPAGDYRVFWVENGKIQEGSTHYTPDIQDAVVTMMAMYERAREQGKAIEISRDNYTQQMIQRYYL